MWYMYIYIYIERERDLDMIGIHIYIYIYTCYIMLYYTIHPVSITRFPLTRFSPGSGLRRNRLFSLVAA